ncbi:MAG: response regulator [Terriglobia bacterium]
MSKDILALLVSSDPGPSEALQRALQHQSVETRRVRTCTEAKEVIDRETRPDVIFSDTTVTDGTWADVLRMARKDNVKAEVVVVSRIADTKLYIDVMERGGFDFIAPPFSEADLAHVVQSATADASKRWGTQMRSSASA